MNRLLYILILLALIPACSSSPVMRQLTVAEELMTDHPDSALTMLRNIDTTALSAKSERALYALLLSQALDKNYIDLKSDSIISFASEYYAITDDQYHNMLAQYYLGRVKYNAGDYPHSLVAMFKAHDIAKELNLNFWIAMTARGIADIYNVTFNAADELEYAKIENENFILYNVQPHINQSFMDLARAHSNARNFNTCISICYNLLDSAKKYNDTILELDISRILGVTYLKTLNHNQAIQFLQKLYKSGYGDSVDSLYLALAYTRIRDFKRALNVASAVSNKNINLYNTVICKISRINGDVEKAFEMSDKIDSISNKQFKDRIGQAISSSVIDYYNLAHHAQKSEIRASKAIMWLIIVISVSLLIIAVFTITIIKRKQNLILEKNMTMAAEFREILSQNENEMNLAKTSIRTLLASKFELFDELCQPIFETQNSTLAKKRISNIISSLIDEYSSNPKKISELEDYVNKHTSGIIRNFKADFPNLKEADYRLFLFSILGFSINTISMFLGETKITSIYNRKRRIRDKIKQSYFANKQYYLACLH